MNTGPRAYIHDIIRAAHSVLIVLYHDHRIAEVPQIFQRSNELVIITLMQTDAGLVQHVEHTGKCTADLGGQADALALAAGKGACGTGQREIIQTHAL